jgi:hypothetical protein
MMAPTQVSGAADHATSAIANSVSTTAAYHPWESDPSSTSVERKLLKLFTPARPDATHLDTGIVCQCTPCVMDQAVSICIPGGPITLVCGMGRTTPH